MGTSCFVHSMDRLACNLDDLSALVQGLTHRGVRVEFVKERAPSSPARTPMSNLMLSSGVPSLNSAFPHQGNED